MRGEKREAKMEIRKASVLGFGKLLGLYLMCLSSGENQ